MRVGLVVVSHSARLAEGVVELAAQMAPDVTVLAAGGLPDGGVGTDYDSVVAAVQRADSGAGVVLLYDLGSAQMTAELAVESLADPGSAVVVDAPLVEGAVAASVAAQGGADRAAVAEAAASAGAPPAVETGLAPEAGAPQTTRLTLHNEVGLHARPAALLVRSIAGLDADVRIRLGDDEADGHSVLALMSLSARKDDTIDVSATGPQAGEAIRRIEALAERNFDE
ncbi:dihydroxyacetone kinase phosphoryl donor subunit DhaM [Prauserella endophytica]|uniref:Phosphocarrier protein HPr n=1 Tax=Prauserella endophytica TaxID=1592324 RepID=A0ABY2RZ36_9PSEU|nr:dihydroxyacetone kinase phosphoryl donor subunit DhaM [Prauserella endophytica]PXY26784.1 PTS sugar transporter subunit IIA [Prauserella coralliicola]TKG66203.1 HPr family phosphocarrier protein [Prauserella endophytica]